MNEVSKAFCEAAEKWSRDLDLAAKRVRKKKRKRPYYNPYTGEVSAIACIMNPRSTFPEDMGR